MFRKIGLAATVATLSMLASSGPLPAQGTAPPENVTAARACAVIVSLTQGESSTVAKAMLAKFAFIADKTPSTAEAERAASTRKILSMLDGGQVQKSQIIGAVPACSSNFGLSIANTDPQILDARIAGWKKSQNSDFSAVFDGRLSKSLDAKSAQVKAKTADINAQTAQVNACQKIADETTATTDAAISLLKSSSAKKAEGLDQQCLTSARLWREARAKSCSSNLTTATEKLMTVTFAKAAEANRQSNTPYQIKCRPGIS